MSIIQEALKKVKKPEEPVFLQRPLIAETKRPTVNKNRFKIIIISGMALVGISLVLFLFAALNSLMNKKMPRDTGVPDIKTIQEVVYKPIAGPENKTDAAGLSLLKFMELRSQYPELVLNGIMYLEDGPRAIINNSIVEVGNTVSGATVTKINRRNVMLEYNGVEITLSLK